MDLFGYWNLVGHLAGPPLDGRPLAKRLLRAPLHFIMFTVTFHDWAPRLLRRSPRRGTIFGAMCAPVATPPMGWHRMHGAGGGY